MNGKDQEGRPWQARHAPDDEQSAVGDQGNGADRLLDSEDPLTGSVVVATRWIRVYTDLLRAKESLMDDLERSIAGSTSEAGVELARIDGSYFGAQQARYQRRLAFWVHRRDELTEVAG